jgi:signal transduction histidine kinase
MPRRPAAEQLGAGAAFLRTAPTVPGYNSGFAAPQSRTAMSTSISSASAKPYRATFLIGALLLAFVLLFGWQSWQSSKAEQISQLRTVAELTERATDRYFLQLQVALASLADEILANDGLSDLAATQQRLSRFQSEHPELLATSVLGLDGQFRATSTTTKLNDLPSAGAQRDFAPIVAAARPDRPMELAQPLFGPVAKRWVLPVRFHLRDRQGVLRAFIIASAPIEMLQTFWSEAPVVSRASIALIRDDGYLINRFPVPQGIAAAEAYGKPRDGAVMQFIRTNGFPRQGYVEGLNKLEGRQTGSVFKRLEHFPVTLVVGMSSAEFRAAWWARTQTAFLLALLLAVACLLGYIHLQRRERAMDEARLQIESRLRSSEAFLARVGELARVGGWSMDLASQQLTWSAQTRRIHEVGPDFQPTLDVGVGFYAPEARSTIAAAVDEAMRTGHGWDLELPLITGTGRPIWVRAQGEVERAGGTPVRLVGAFQDVTEYRQRRLELQQEHELRAQAEMHTAALDKLLRERSEMLSVLAHEVRQPLHNAAAALQGAKASLAQVGELGPGHSLVRAQSVLARVLANIDNTLAVAALLASEGSLRREDTDIDTLVSLAIEDMPADQRHRIRIERLTPTRTAAMDLGLMRLALRNLIANALRYSPPDTTVTVRVADSDEPLALLIEVIDGGPGIAPELSPHLFERGVRGQHDAGSPGHGLGLYIVKRVMDLHGGQVQVFSKPAHGARMRLVIDQTVRA